MMDKLIVIKRYSGFFDRDIYYVVPRNYKDSGKTIIQMCREAVAATIHKNKAYSIASKLNDINLKLCRQTSLNMRKKYKCC